MSDDLSINSLNASLNKLSDFAPAKSSGSAAKVKRKSKKGQSWKSDESTDNLFDNILNDIQEETSAEEARKEREKIAQEEAKKAEKELEELQKKAEAEALLMEEALKLQQTQEKRSIQLAAITRQKKIEAGEIDLEEEARQKRAEEELKQRKIQEENARISALNEAQKLIEQQDAHLKELATKPLEEAMKKKKSNLWKVLVAILAVLILLAAAGYLDYNIFQRGPVYHYFVKNANVYDIDDNYPFTSMAFKSTEATLLSVDHKLVDQGIVEAPKPKKQSSGKKADAPAAAEPKKSALGGRSVGLGF